MHLITNKFKNKSFTLAEIMIALTIIGIITAILLPVAISSVPNENVMKFKKGHATLFKVINELVSSGEYYTVGDLGKKPDGSWVDGTHDGDYPYLCETFADILNVKNVDCSKDKVGTREYYPFIDIGTDFEMYRDNPQDWLILNDCSLTRIECWFDSGCYLNSEKVDIIKTSDNISYYQINTAYPFGINHPDFPSTKLFYDYKNELGKSRVYKYFCMDIDGIDKGEEPFGYGIRVDGKIIPGAQAQAWLEKSIQDKE